MKNVVCKCNVKVIGDRKYKAGEYAIISDEIYERYGEEIFQLIEDVPVEETN